MDVCVSRYSLGVDASETIRVVLDSGDIRRGRRLYDALTFATSQQSAYAVAPYVPIVRKDFDPAAGGRADMPDIAGDHVGDVLRALECAGLATVHDVWSEQSGQAYLSEGRTVTAVQVLRSFALVGVRYWLSWEANRRLLQYGYVDADRWEITDRTYIVPAGWYVMGEVGDYSQSLVGVAAVDISGHVDAHDVAEHLVSWVSEIDGFGASRCSAECQTCGTGWYAESGSWHFRPEYGTSVDGWDFDDADDFDDHGMISCPECGTGRVGFLIS